MNSRHGECTGKCVKSAIVSGMTVHAGGQLLHRLVRQREKRIEQTELMDHFQRRRMDGVAAKIPEEVAVLFQHDDVDAGPREQKAEHHARGAAADDATAGVERRRHRVIKRRLSHRSVDHDCSSDARASVRFPDAFGRRGIGAEASPPDGADAAPFRRRSSDIRHGARLRRRSTQNVHSNEQIRASVESGGRSLSQHSQPGRNASMAEFLMFGVTAADVWSWNARPIASPSEDATTRGRAPTSRFADRELQYPKPRASG